MRKLCLLGLLLLACVPTGPPIEELRSHLADLQGQIRQIEAVLPVIEERKAIVRKLERQIAAHEAWKGDPGKVGPLVARTVKSEGTGLVELECSRDILMVRTRAGKSERKLETGGGLDLSPAEEEQLTVESFDTSGLSERAGLEKQIEEAEARLARAKQDVASLPELTARMEELQKKDRQLWKAMAGREHQVEDPDRQLQNTKAELGKLLGKRGKVVGSKPEPITLIRLDPKTPGGFPGRYLTLELQGQPGPLSQFLAEAESGKANRWIILDSVKMDRSHATVRLFAVLR